jgi:hypothetical protein
MQNDGRVLPSLAETVVLNRLGLIRTDELPMVAARWLAADLVDTESIRLLAGHDSHDPWELERLLVVAADEVGVTSPTDPAAEENIAVSWVTDNWREDRDTRGTVAVLARLGVTHYDWDLGLFVGLDDEWNSRWGRLESDLEADAELQLDFLLHRDG